MLKEELRGLEKQIEECLTCAFQKGYNMGTVDRVPDVEKAREQGRNEAWECARKILFDGDLPRELLEYLKVDTFCGIIEEYSASEAISKIYEYEDGKKTAIKDDVIRIGDEVRNRRYRSTTFVVTHIDRTDNTITGYGATGNFADRKMERWEKTGRHFPEIGEVWKTLVEESEGER